MFRVVGLARHGGSVQAVIASPPPNRTRSKMLLKNGVTSPALVRCYWLEFQLAQNLFQLDDGRATHPSSTQEAIQQVHFLASTWDTSNILHTTSSLRTLITRVIL